MPGDSARPHEFSSLSIFSGASTRATDFRCVLSKEDEWHTYNLMRAEAWAMHTLKRDEKKIGIRSVITKTETRGPYTRPFTVYFVHTKTAFSVKGVCKRFSEFKELDQTVRKAFPMMKAQLPPDKVFNSLGTEFVAERRKALQIYLDDMLSSPEIASNEDLHAFLGIPEYNQELSKENEEEDNKEKKRSSSGTDDRPETFLRSIERAKAAGDRIAEAKAFNALGLLYCEHGLESQGVECMESALELCRAEEDEKGIVTVLGNLGCFHNILECQDLALACFKEAHEILAGDPAGQSDFEMKLALTYAANGDNFEAVEHSLLALKIFKQLDDVVKEASCLFTLGSIYYEAGEVRQAVEAFEQCLVLRRKTRDKIGLAEALNKLGLTYCDIGYDLRAIDYFEQSLVICEDSADFYGQGVCLMHLGNVFKMQKDSKLAIDFFERCLAVRQKVSDRPGVAACHDSLGLVYYGLGDFKKATEHYESALVMREKLGDLEAMCECVKSIGTAYIRMDNTQSAIQAFKRCLEIQRKLSNDTGEVDALISLGLAHFKAGNNSESVNHLEEALRLFNNLPPDDAGASSGRAVCLDHLGNVYSKMGRSEKAVTFYTMSLRIKREVRDKTGEARCLVRVGLEFLSLGEMRQSIESFHEALKLFESLEDDNGISVCFENLGESYMKLGEIDGAIEAYERCLLIKTELWDKVGQAQCLDALGLAYYSKGDFKGAAQCYEKSITLWRAEGDKSALMACCEALGGANFQLGEHVRSIECYVQFLTLSHEVGEGGAISQDIGDGAQILLRLGISNSAIGEYPVSIEFLDQALSYYVELGDIKSRAVCLQHLGAAKGRNGNFEGGIKDLEQSMKICEEGKDEAGVARCQEEIGLLHYNEGECKPAREHLEAATKILSETTDKAGAARCTMHIGATHAASGEHTMAVATFKTALTVGESAPGGWPEKIDCLVALGASQMMSGDANSAIQSYNLATQMWQAKGNRAGEACCRVKVADARLRLKQYEKALDELEKAMELRGMLEDRTGLAECLMRKGDVLVASRQMREAAEAYGRSKAMRESAGDEFGLAECDYSMAQLMAAEGRMDEAVDMHVSALEMRRRIGDRMGVVESLGRLGACMGHYGDFDRALEYFDECLVMMRDGNDRVREGKCLVNMGTTYAEMGDTDSAIEKFEEALILARGCGDTEGEAACYCNIGSARAQDKQTADALESYDIGLRLLKNIGNEKGVAECMHNIGAVHFNNGNTEEAVKLFDAAFQKLREMKEAELAANCLHSLKAAYIRLGDNDKAEDCVQLIQEYFPDNDVQSIAEQLEIELERVTAQGDLSEEATVLVQLGDALVQSEHVALEHFRRALEIREGLGDRKGSCECNMKIGKIKAGQADFRAALECFKAASKYYDGGWRDGTEKSVQAAADCFNSLGECCLQVGENKDAVLALKRCLALREEIEDEAGCREVKSQLGVTYQRLGDTRNAMSSLLHGKVDSGSGGGLDEPDPGKVVGLSSVASTMMNLRRREECQRNIAKLQSTLSLYKTRGDVASEANCQYALGQALSEIQQPLRAAESFSTCVQLRRELGDVEGETAALKRQGCCYLDAGNAKRASEDLEEYLGVVSQQADRTRFLDKNFEDARREEVDACCMLGRAYLVQGSVVNACEALKRALALTHESGDRSGEAKCLESFGRLYQDLWIGRRATEHYERAFATYIELNDKGGEARCLMRLGMLNFDRGETAQCRKCMEEALALCKQNIIGVGEGDCLMAIGDVLWRLGDYPQTKAHYSLAAKLCREQQDRVGEARAICGLSNVNLALGECYQSIEQIMEALTIYNEVSDSAGQASALRSLAKGYAAQGKLPTANKVAEQAKAISIECGDVLAAAQSDVILSEILLDSGEWDAAIRLLLEVKEVFSQTADLSGIKVFLCPKELGNTLCALGDAYRRAGQRDMALGAFQQAGVIFKASEDAHGLTKQLCMSALVFATHTANGHTCSSEEMHDALSRLKESTDKRQSHGNRFGVAECILNQGILLTHQGDTQKGAKKLGLAFDMFKELKDKRGQAKVLLEMGHGCHNSERGIVHYEQCLVICREINDLVNEADCLDHLGALQSYLGNTQASIKCWLDSLNLRRELGHVKGLRQCLEQLCLMYSRLEDWAQVTDFVSKLRDVAKQEGDVEGEAHALILTAKCQHSLGASHKAISTLQSCLYLCRQNKESEQLLVREAECHDKLASIYYDLGMVSEGKQEHEQVQRLRKKLGKEVLMSVVSESKPTGIKSRVKNLFKMRGTI